MPKKSNPPSDSPPPWQSHLEPFRADIWRWRRSGKTYREIAELLRHEKKFETTFSTVRKFVEARKRRFAELDLPPAPEELAARAAVSFTPQLPRPTSTVSSPLPHASSPAPVPVTKPTPGSPKTGSHGLPLTASQEVVGSDQLGRAVTRNKPFRGKI